MARLVDVSWEDFPGGAGKGYIMKMNNWTWPLPPSSITVSYENRNETIDLANGQEMNLRKAPGLAVTDLEVTLPYRPYPHLRGWAPPRQYIEQLKALKSDKPVFRLVIYRYGRGWKQQKWHYSQEVTLEDWSYTQEADEGEDLTLSLSFKQWKSYKTKKVTIKKKPDKNTTTTTTKKPGQSKKPSSSTYTVKKDDTLSQIAAKKLGSSKRGAEIYKLNKTVIEKEAKKRGRKSSSNGHWIYPGTKLKLPKK